MLATTCKCVEAFLDTIVAKGCTQLQLGGCNAFASKYKLKKNPAITAVETPRALATEKSSIWGSARGYLASRHTRAISGVSSPHSEEGNYYRKSSRFSISAPWISLTPSPELGQVTKLTIFAAHSVSFFRPPFSQWTFTLLKASPITFVTLCFKDLPTDALESKLILDRLAEAVPDVTIIHLDRVRPGLMEDVVSWLGIDSDDLGLPAYARLPHLRKLASSSSVLCSYLASCRSIGAGINSSHLVMRYMWTSSTRSAVSTFIKDVERFHNAVLEALSGPEVKNSNIRIKLRFDRFSYRAKELKRIWSHQNQLDGGEDKALQTQQCVYRSNSGPWYGLCLELNLPATAGEIQQGAVDEEGASVGRGMFLAEEQLEKLRTVCPKLDYGWIC
ncbi:hypothetical protein EST38_g5549 [Candolleomyces aberdarensis]|uniref:Uncharacterized protein n=1 Tax=Candolleomyces aberdarensis TaxID=2316362 RepID=A0A4Q2DK72_9AGAR|nr:hypothetical protein EST38_g5549 [Candolleomyces aberdarensis]